jgi:hypothetical protein
MTPNRPISKVNYVAYSHAPDHVGTEFAPEAVFCFYLPEKSFEQLTQRPGGDLHVRNHLISQREIPASHYLYLLGRGEIFVVGTQAEPTTDLGELTQRLAEMMDGDARRRQGDWYDAVHMRTPAAMSFLQSIQKS